MQQFVAHLRILLRHLASLPHELLDRLAHRLDQDVGALGAALHALAAGVGAAAGRGARQRQAVQLGDQRLQVELDCARGFREFVGCAVPGGLVHHFSVCVRSSAGDKLFVVFFFWF